MMKFVISGSRKHPQPSLATVFLDYISEEDEVLIGDCPTGIDKYAKEYCEEQNIPYTIFEADWDKYGLAAGPKRNKAMLDTKPDLVLALPYGESKGTRDVIKQARKANLRIYVLEVIDPVDKKS
jgi:hypothetical protein